MEDKWILNNNYNLYSFRTFIKLIYDENCRFANNLQVTVNIMQFEHFLLEGLDKCVCDSRVYFFVRIFNLRNVIRNESGSLFSPLNN